MNSKNKTLLYLSQGLFETGGYHHELLLSKSLSQFYGISEINFKIKRINKSFENGFQYIVFLFKVFFQNYSDVNVVTARTALMSILKNWFNNKKIFVVIHNHDEQMNYSKSFKIYLKILFKIVKKCSNEKVKVVVGSKFWVNYFKEKFDLNTCVFPNLFEVNHYQKFSKRNKNNWIYLGQWSSKNDDRITELAQKLSRNGFYCFFSTNDFNEPKAHNGSFEIINFFSHNDFLEQVSLSLCTLALTKINEGWNRVAHESLLLGTPVIGYKKGGLGDLLSESNSIAVKNIEEAYECIIGKLFIMPDNEFIIKYDLINASKYLSKFLIR